MALNLGFGGSFALVMSPPQAEYRGLAFECFALVSLVAVDVMSIQLVNARVIESSEVFFRAAEYAQEGFHRRAS